MRLLVIETHRHTALCLPLSFDCLAVKVDSPYYSAILCTYWHLYFCRLPPSLPLLASQISLEELDIQRRERERVWQFGRIKRWIIWRSAPLWLLPANFWKAKLTLILSSYRTCVLSSSFCVFFFGVVVLGALWLVFCIAFLSFSFCFLWHARKRTKIQKTKKRETGVVPSNASLHIRDAGADHPSTYCSDPTFRLVDDDDDDDRLLTHDRGPSRRGRRRRLSREQHVNQLVGSDRSRAHLLADQ